MKTKITVLGLLILLVLSGTLDWYYVVGECKPFKEGRQVTPYVHQPLPGNKNTK